MRNIERIFIHCTASSCKATVESIMNEFKHRGWNKPGYHYLISANGLITQTLNEQEISNGVKGYNATAVNIAYIGGIGPNGKICDTRTIEQKAAIVHLLLMLRERYPKARIMGHRDIWGENNPEKWKKLCPAFNASREYEAI